MKKEKQNPIDYIAELIENGYMHGWNPRWKLTLLNSHELFENVGVRIEIARQIKDGHRKGVHPSWQLENLQSESVQELKRRKEKNKTRKTS